MLRASSPRICSRATQPSSSMRSIQDLRISRLHGNEMRSFSTKRRPNYPKSLSHCPMWRRWKPSSLSPICQLSIRSDVSSAYIPVETSWEKTSAGCGSQQGLGFSQSCSSLFIIIIGGGAVFFVVPFVGEFFIDDGGPVEIPDTTNQVGGYSFREFFKVRFLLGGEIFGVGENFREAPVVSFDKSRNSLVENSSCNLLLSFRR